MNNPKLQSEKIKTLKFAIKQLGGKIAFYPREESGNYILRFLSHDDDMSYRYTFMGKVLWSKQEIVDAKLEKKIKTIKEKESFFNP